MSIHSNLKINNQVILKNRVVVPPMASATANESGYATEKTLTHYQNLARSKAGLLMVEYTYVSPDGRSEPNQLGIDENEKIRGLSSISKIITASGSVAAIQLTHSGGKSSTKMTGGRMIGPSGLRVPTKGEQLEIPEIATEDDIQILKKNFLNAAIRAKQAGFQMVELHAAHGYGLNQWISPLTNKRKDQYGGSREKRARILLEIVELIKTHHQDLALSIRMPGLDHFDGGMTYEDSIFLAKGLEQAGADLLNISSGIGGWKRPGVRKGEGYLVSDAEIIQKEVKIPIIGVGGIKTSGYISRALIQKKFSLAAVGRAILENPMWGPNIGLT